MKKQFLLFILLTFLPTCYSQTEQKNFFGQMVDIVLKWLYKKTMPDRLKQLRQEVFDLDTNITNLVKSNGPLTGQQKQEFYAKIENKYNELAKEHEFYEQEKLQALLLRDIYILEKYSLDQALSNKNQGEISSILRDLRFSYLNNCKKNELEKMKVRAFIKKVQEISANLPEPQKKYWQQIIVDLEKTCDITSKSVIAL